MDHVYIAYAPDDGDEVGPLAEMLRGAGFGVRFGPVVEPGVNHRERIETEIADAVAVLVIWSSHSVVSPRVMADAAFAAERGNLVAVRIDAASLPLTSGAVIDLSEGQNLSSGPGARAILAAIAALPGRPARAAGRDPLPGPAAASAVAHRPGKARGLVIVSAIAIGGLLATGAAMLVSQAMRESEAARTGRASAAPAAPADLPAARAIATDHGEALEAWALLAKDDPLSVRAFLATHGAAPVGEQARGVLARLERAQWAEVATRRDAAAILDALSAYRADFPDGLFSEEAVEIERRERERIAEAQDLLKAAGLAQAEADGILKPDTLAAVRTFQTSMGLSPTGLIDVGLMQALRLSDRRPSGSGPATGPETGRLPAAAPAEPPPQAPPPASAPGAPMRDCYVCPELIPLPAGSFMMGDVTGAAPADERPAHEVKIAYRLAVGRYEVTFEEWDACVLEGGCRHRPDDAGKGRGNRPVVDVSPADISDYLAWITRKTGKRYRLLSEAEWEYAARAGTTAAWYSGNEPRNLCTFGNGADAGSTYAWRNTGCSDPYPAAAAPVGSFRPNPFGLYDMMGNVWEWTADCWHSSYADAPADGSAWVRDCETSDLVLRGGAYSVDVDKMRSSYRYHFAPRRMPFFGFRVARPFD